MAGTANSGRKTKLTPKFIKRFCVHLRSGNFPYTVCRLVSISTTTYETWKALGKAGHSPLHIEFNRACEEAEALHENDLVMAQTERAKTSPDFRAGQSFLERRYAKSGWKPPAQVSEITGNIAHNVDLTITDLGRLSVEEMRNYSALLSKMQAAEPLGISDGNQDAIDVEVIQETSVELE